MFNLRDKAVLITGASEGIGAACVDAFRARGARLILTARNGEKLRQLAAPGDLVLPGDITQPAHRERLVSGALAAAGSIDVLVNNAGMGNYWPASTAPLDDVRQIFELNLFAPLALIQAILPHMRERRSGAIVNVGSVAGKIPLPWMPLYSSTKFALGALTDSLRMELRASRIHAITVCPGYVRTDFQKHAAGPRPPASVSKGKRFAISPEQCAAAIVRGVERQAHTVFTPASFRALAFLYKIFPGIFEAKMTSLYEADRES